MNILFSHSADSQGKSKNVPTKRYSSAKQHSSYSPKNQNSYITTSNCRFSSIYAKVCIYFFNFMDK